MRSLLLALTLMTSAVATAGGDPLPVGARPAGMGNASMTLVDLWCLRHNTAGLAGLDKPVAGLFYQRHWLSEDLAMQGLAFAIPLGKGTIAATGTQFGFDLYTEQQFGLAYAMRLSEGLRVGVQLDYLNVRLGDNYGSTSMVAAEIGVQARITEKLWMGAHVYNPNQAQLGGPYDEHVPTVFRAGLGYTFSDQLLVTGSVDKDIDQPETFHAGLEYHPVKVLYVRTGISSGPVQGHFGVGLRLGQLDVDMAVSVRSTLGTTPQLNLNYRFK